MGSNYDYDHNTRYNYSREVYEQAEEHLQNLNFYEPQSDSSVTHQMNFYTFYTSQIEIYRDLYQYFFVHLHHFEPRDVYFRSLLRSFGSNNNDYVQSSEASQEQIENFNFYSAAIEMDQDSYEQWYRLADYFDSNHVNELVEDSAISKSAPIADEDAAKILGSPSEGIKYDGENNLCAICLDPLKESCGDLKELPCKHVFHYNCILEATKIKNTCPMCRGKYDCRQTKI